MFEFVCDHVVPGCHHKDQDAEKEKLLDRAVAHLSEHHDLAHLDEPIDEGLRRTGIQFIRPV